MGVQGIVTSEQEERARLGEKRAEQRELFGEPSREYRSQRTFQILNLAILKSLFEVFLFPFLVTFTNRLALELGSSQGEGHRLPHLIPCCQATGAQSPKLMVFNPQDEQERLFQDFLEVISKYLAELESQKARDHQSLKLCPQTVSLKLHLKSDSVFCFNPSQNVQTPSKNAARDFIPQTTLSGNHPGQSSPFPPLSCQDHGLHPGNFSKLSLSFPSVDGQLPKDHGRNQTQPQQILS